MLETKQFLLICDFLRKASNLSELEKQICYLLLNPSIFLSRRVRLTVSSIGLVGNVALSEAAVKIGHGAGNFNDIIESMHSPFLFSAEHGGWDENGDKIIFPSNFSLPGNKSDTFYCTFFLSPKLLDNTAMQLFASYKNDKKHKNILTNRPSTQSEDWDRIYKLTKDHSGQNIPVFLLKLDFHNYTVGKHIMLYSQTGKPILRESMIARNLGQKVYNGKRKRMVQENHLLLLLGNCVKNK